MSEITGQPSASPALPEPLLRMLDRVRARWLAVRVAEFPVLLVAGLAFAWVLQGLADRALELTWQTRLILLSLNALSALVLLALFVFRPWRYQPDRRQAALIVERQRPQFRTSLISAVELGSAAGAVPLASRALVRRLVEEVAQAVEREDLAPQVVSASQLKRIACWAAAALVLAGCGVAFAGSLSPLLLRRILLSREPFPAETQVVNGTGDLVVVAGADAALSASAQGVLPSTGRLVVTYPDGRVETLTISPAAGEPSRFAFPVKNVREPFGYRFELNDGIGPDHQVTVRFPPTVKELHFVQVYPKYTGLPDAEMSPAYLRLLEGSKLRLTATASAPLRSATLEIKGADEPVKVTIPKEHPDVLQAELTVPATGWKSLSLHLEDAGGEPSVNDPAYRVELVTDQPPVATLTLPKKDATVLATAQVPVAFKVSDDFGLHRVAFRYRIVRPGETPGVENSEDGEFPFEIPAGEKSMSRTMTWDLSRLEPPVTPGCTITCWAEAEDTHVGKTGRGTVTRSAEKTLSIVTEAQKREELVEQLGERARDLERLYDLQRKMSEKTDNSLR